MPKYEIEIDNSYVEALNTLARNSHLSASEWIRRLVMDALEAHRGEPSAEFRRVVDEVILEHEALLRRLAQ